MKWCLLVLTFSRSKLSLIKYALVTASSDRFVTSRYSAAALHSSSQRKIQRSTDASFQLPRMRQLFPIYIYNFDKLKLQYLLLSSSILTSIWIIMTNSILNKYFWTKIVILVSHKNAVGANCHTCPLACDWSFGATATISGWDNVMPGSQSKEVQMQKLRHSRSFSIFSKISLNSAKKNLMSSTFAILWTGIRKHLSSLYPDQAQCRQTLK